MSKTRRKGRVDLWVPFSIIYFIRSVHLFVVVVAFLKSISVDDICLRKVVSICF